MEMTKEWASKLKDLEIFWQEKEDHILFYDPYERGDGMIQVRKYMKDCPEGDYISRRIGVMSPEEFKKIKSGKLKKYKDLLKELGAPHDFIHWVGDKTVEEANKECLKGAQMLWVAKALNIPKKELVLAAAHCINTVRHLIKDEQNLACIDASIAYGNGEITEDELSSIVNAVSYYARGDGKVGSAVYYVATADACHLLSFVAYASADASAADASSYKAPSAKKENQLKTADICRKYIGKLIEERVNQLIYQREIPNQETIILLKDLPNFPKGRKFKSDIDGNYFPIISGNELVAGNFKPYNFTKKEVKSNPEWFSTKFESTTESN